MSQQLTLHVRALRSYPDGSRLGTPERLLLMVLADHYSDITGYANPSVATLTEETGLSEQRIHELVQALTAGGLLCRTGNGGRKQSSRFTFPDMGIPKSLTVSENGQSSLGVSGEKGQGNLTVLDEAPAGAGRKGSDFSAETVRDFGGEVAKRSEISDPKEYTGKDNGKETVSVLPILPPVESTEPAPSQKGRAKKTKADKPPADPRVNEVRRAIEQQQGHDFGSPAAENAAIKRMLMTGFEPEMIIACWKLMDGESWRSKPVRMATVNNSIGAYRAGKLAQQQPRAAPNGTGPPLREAQQPVGELVFNIRNRPRPAGEGGPSP